MKMKKLVMCAAAGIVAISCARANDSDVNQLRLACQNSDKTLWDERNQVCIPADPCSNTKYMKYCNNTFRNVETRGVGYRILIDVYAKTHNLSCKAPTSQKAKLIGDDYVVCEGTDVMVFRFDDIREGKLIEKVFDPIGVLVRNKDVWKKTVEALCMATGGNPTTTNYACYGITESKCNTVASVLSDYGFASEHVTWSSYDNSCYISTSETGGFMDESKF